MRRPSLSVDIPYNELMRLFADLYAEYWLTRRELAELTDYLLKAGMAPSRDFTRGT
jgi:hypothetical protein